ncbi:pilus assembly protein CpaA [Brevundimonas sp. S30B]|uniref:A24 family peptidase n=1 Tax=unclassified Brevundimonas TaxID=2622653 RepID=UPI0010720CAA|nr:MULTISPECIES: prepilin peptidase [unclassified Brevundimonas]QBX36344.1 pilus assembly protein CpaA [Brevundimonas sp. MF30-B]TFW01053.1 pilus assembly protein CpaA [Brevundimonas sp. S30B]
MDTVTLILLSILPALTIVAGLHDLTTMKIPNWISLALLAGFFPAALAAGLDGWSLAGHLGVAAGALVLGAGLFALNWIGGGDAKLMAAASLWMGLTGSLFFLAYTAMIGGLFCLILMSARAYAPRYVHAGTPGWIAQLMRPKGDIPYGVAIAAGVLLAFPSSPLVQLFTGA